MYTNNALLDLHNRTHRVLVKLLDHCSQLAPEELHQEIPGFGYPTIQRQFHHQIGAEEYWIGVLQGRVEADDNSDQFPSIEMLSEYRTHVFTVTAAYLSAVSSDTLNTATEMMTWGDRRVTLKPAHVFMRTLTHIHHHNGQILAMCRLLDKPASGFDFPITDDL